MATNIFAPMMASIGSNLGTIMYWVGVVLSSVAILGILAFVFIFLQYKYHVTIFIRGGTGFTDNETDEEKKNRRHSVGKIVHKRAKFMKKNGVERLFFWMQKGSVDPVNFKNIYPGNKIFLYQVGLNEFVPVEFNCGNPEAVFNPLPYNIRRWQNLEIQEAYKDYQEDNWWKKNSGFIMMIATVLILTILTGLVFYWAYTFIGEGLGSTASATNNLADALKNAGTQKFGGS